MSATDIARANSDNEDRQDVWAQSEKIFGLMMAGFALAIVLTNIIGVKLFLAFPKTLPSGIFDEPITRTTGLLTYPLTFLFTDIVCSVHRHRLLCSPTSSAKFGAAAAPT